MISTLKFILANQMRRSQRAEKTSGFTLIELLVSMVLAVLVITPLLALAVNILDTDRKEQAKANSEQDIQTALNYMAQDLQQAVYIYDVNGVEHNNDSTTVANSGIKDQIPPTPAASGCPITNSTCTPVLVFWKRQLLDKDTTIGGVRVGTATSVNGAIAAGTGDDAAVYSLVAYYLIEDNPTSCGSTWSCTARIGRWESRGGIRTSSSAAVNGITPTSRVEGTQTVYYLISPTLGFMPFDLTLAGGLSAQMNQWKKHSTEAYNGTATGTQVQPQVQILTDYIDQSAASAFGQTCTTSQTQVPSTINAGFYACVDSTKTTAQIFLRGNALARISPKSSAPTYNSSQSIYFPTSSIQVQGRGLISN